MKLIDTDETVIIVTGSDIRAEERDRPTAYRLKEEVDARSDGQRFRRAVVVGDLWYLENRVFQLNPTVAIGGPGVNALAARLANTLPVVWSQADQAYVQADLEGEQKRVLLWGMDAGATMVAVQAFTSQGYLEDLLRRIWKFRTETYV
ncbi:MAG: hypothetical protein OEW17_08885 [Gemmatimonadota bacterium]|nr:hypothetical protein [Gemmatimonadota bacterium]MDH5282491.1 hypothetical protein [Gemmatimonadota bacterium]